MKKSVLFFVLLALASACVSSKKFKALEAQQKICAEELEKMKQSNQDYEADLANSSIQGGGKGGWCYIGDDKGFRSCAKVETDNMCMSGDIFPSQEVCVNPNLRT